MMKKKNRCCVCKYHLIGDDDDVFVVVDDDEDDDDYEMDEQIRKENLLLERIEKKRTQHECGVCEKSFSTASNLKATCVFTRTRNRMNAMFARCVFVNLVI